MKQVHNARLRVQAATKDELSTLFKSILAQAAIQEEEARITYHKAEGNYEEECSGELWLDHQQPVRKLLKLIKATLPQEQQQLIAKEPEKYLDTQTHCFVHFSIESLKAGQWTLHRGADAAILRLNIAAFPATKERAAKVVKDIFG